MSSVPPDADIFPPGTTPEDRRGRLSAVCSLGTRPTAVTGMLRQLLLQHFCDPQHIAHPELRRKFENKGGWKPTEDTGILIESHTRWDPSKLGIRPAVIIKRNRWDWNRITIGDEGDVEPDDWMEGIESFTGMWIGSTSLFCLAKLGIEAELLGAEVARLVLHYKQIIAEQLDLLRFTLIGVDEVHEIEEAKEHFAVPVNVAYNAQETWVIQQEAPRFKRLRFHLSELFQ